MRAYGITDIGKTRTINQDSYAIEFFEDSNIGIFLVCDGMGGVKGGEIASGIAVNTIMNELRMSIRPKMSKTAVKNAVGRAIKLANSNIIERAKKDGALLGMGTTCVCAIADSNGVIVANVGDSRAYVVENEKIRQVSIDHSLVNDLVKAGEISPEEAVMHPQKNIITRALGVDNDVDIDYFHINIKEDMFFLMCTDGLTNEVSDIEICYEVLNDISEKETCEGLVDIANRRGGHDNITIVLVAF